MSQGDNRTDNHMTDTYGYLTDIYNKQGAQILKVVWSLTKKGKNSGWLSEKTSWKIQPSVE